MLNRLRSLINRFPKPTASKWGSGIGLLWRGNTAKLFFAAVKGALFGKPPVSQAGGYKYLFESSRVAIYNYCKHIDLSMDDRVQVCGFTCDAVIDAIRPFGSKVSLYDCDLSLQARDFVLEGDTKLLICQVTFGVPALDRQILALARSRNVKILIDKSLSYGAFDFEALADVDYPEVYSFEVSKSFTIGWGGVLRLPKHEESSFSRDYCNLDRVSDFDDVSRVFRSALNFFMVKRGGRFAYAAWWLLRVLGAHRASKKSSSRKYHVKSKMGRLSQAAFQNIFPEIPLFLRKSNFIHSALKGALESKGLSVISKTDKYVSTPRIAFLVNPDQFPEFRSWFERHDIEVGRWFDTLPLNGSDLDKLTLPGCQTLFKSVANLPCHGSLSEEEVTSMCECIKAFDFIGHDEARWA